jgi:hypothetical protein
LTALTLHGNPLEAKNGLRSRYRLQTISLLPTLKQLDFCLISEAERVMASHKN